MIVNKRTVLNETYVHIHVQWTEKSGNQISFDWLIESDKSPWSFLGVSKFVIALICFGLFVLRFSVLGQGKEIIFTI